MNTHRSCDRRNSASTPAAQTPPSPFGPARKWPRKPAPKPKVPAPRRPAEALPHRTPGATLRPAVTPLMFGAPPKPRALSVAAQDQIDDWYAERDATTLLRRLGLTEMREAA